MFGINKLYHFQKLRGILTSLLLLLILLFNVSGYYICFNLAQNKIQNEIKARIRGGIKDEELIIIQVTLNNQSEIRWIKANKELTYHGEMYDVVRIKTIDGKKAYYCINDVKEKKLIADFARKSESNQKARKLLSNFSTNFILQPGLLFPINEPSNHDFCIASFDIQSKIKEVAVPPPKTTSA